MLFRKGILCGLVVVAFLVMPSVHADVEYEAGWDEDKNSVKELPGNMKQFVTSGVQAPSNAWKDAVNSQKKEKHKMLGIPKSALKFLYSGFEGIGSMMDAVGTGDRPVSGSLKGKADPFPITEHDRRF